MVCRNYLLNNLNLHCNGERERFEYDQLKYLILRFLCIHHYATYGTISFFLINEMPSATNTSNHVLARCIKEGLVLSLSVKGELVYNDKTVYVLSSKGLSFVRSYVPNDVYLSCKRALRTLHKDDNAMYATHGALASYTVMQIVKQLKDAELWYELPIRNIFTSQSRIVSNTPFTDAVIRHNQNYISIEQDMNTCGNADIYKKIIRYFAAGTIGFADNEGLTIQNTSILFSCHDKTYISRKNEVSVSCAEKILHMLEEDVSIEKLYEAVKDKSLDDKILDGAKNISEYYSSCMHACSSVYVLKRHISTLKTAENPLKYQLIAENELKSVNGRMKYLVKKLLELLSRAEADDVLLTERTVILKVLDGAAFTCVPSLLVSKFYNGGLIGLMKDAEYIRKLSINAIYAYTDEDELSEMPLSNECSFVNFAPETSFEAKELRLTMRNSVLVRYPGLKTVGMYVHIEDLSDVFAWIRAVFYLRYSELSPVRSRLLLIATEDEARRFAEIVGNGGYSGEDMYAGGGRAGNGRFCFVSREDFLSCSEDNVCFYLPNDEPLYF